MNEYDVFDRIVKDYGAPDNAEAVGPQKAHAFESRVPRRLIDFWRDFGWGSWRNGYMWMCDPAPFDPFLEMIFAGDRELRHEDLTLIAYTAFCELKIWDKNGHTLLIDLNASEVFIQPPSAMINPETNTPFKKEFLIGLLLQDELELAASLYEKSASTLGPPAAGEIFGYVPALQLGGAKSIENMRKTNALAYMTFVAQLEPMKLVQLSQPRPGFPFGEFEFVRLIGG